MKNSIQKFCICFSFGIVMTISFRGLSKGFLGQKVNSFTMALLDWQYKKNPIDFIVLEDQIFNHIDSRNYSSETEENDSISIDAAELLLVSFLDGDYFTKLKYFGNSADNQIMESLELISSKTLTKSDRTLMHRSIRTLFPFLESRTNMDKNNTNFTTITVFNKGARSIKATEIDNLNSKRSNKKKVVSKRWNSKNPDYFHFTLLKNGLTTNEAIENLASQTHLLSSRYEYCGSKDKKAVTMQRVSVWRLELEKLMSVQSSRTMNVMHVIPATAPLKLGNLAGNHFIITLRRTEENLFENILSDTQKETILEGTLLTSPFINLFGSQRFGSSLQVNPEVGKNVLKGDYRSAVLLILLEPSNRKEIESVGWNLQLLKEISSHSGSHLQTEWSKILEKSEKSADDVMHAADTIEMLEEDSDIIIGVDHSSEEAAGNVEDVTSVPIQEESFVEKTTHQPSRTRYLMQLIDGTVNVSDRIPRYFALPQRKLIGSILDHHRRSKSANATFTFDEVDFQTVFSSLPKQLRMLFVNSYQSYLWNNAASQRMNALLGSDDRLWAKEGDIVLVNRDRRPLIAWDIAAGNYILNADKVERWNLLVQDDKSFNDSRNLAYLEFVDHEIAQQKLFSIESVVIPLPGYATHDFSLPASMMSTLQEDNSLESLVGGQTVVAYRVPGAYRHVVSTARNIRYSDGDDHANFSPIVHPMASTAAPFSDAVDAAWRSNAVPNLLQELRSNYSDPHCHNNNDSFTLAFSLCASSYATVFMDSVLVSL